VSNVSQIEPRARVVLRLPKVRDKTGMSRPAIYRGMAKGTFPRSIKIGERACGWLADEIDDWLQQRINERDRKEAS
jgi:prophage regulatory protein